MPFAYALKGFVVLLSILGATAYAGESLDIDGYELSVTKRQAPRNAPDRYYQQAMDSIPAIHPTGRIISKIPPRTSDDGMVYYTLVSYVSDAEGNTVDLGGVVQRGTIAWTFNAELPLQGYEVLEAKIIAAVIALASNMVTSTSRHVFVEDREATLSLPHAVIVPTIRGRIAAV